MLPADSNSDSDKPAPRDAMDSPPETVLVIPMPMASIDRVMHEIVEAGDGRYEGREAPPDGETPGVIGLLDTKTNWACVCQMRPREPHLHLLFEKIGHGRVTKRDAFRVSEHRGILVLSAPGGSVESARWMMDAGAAAMHAGGLGLAVESSGLGHTPDQWLELAGNDDPAALYFAYIATIGKSRRLVYTCGMHNFGLRDALTEAFTDHQEAAFVMHSFLKYTYETDNTIHDGDPIGSEEDGPLFRVFREKCRLHDPRDLFFNPYGMWRVVPM
ncbi:MAG: DUF4261 domain-containing protein [Phycisphaeraceae bacterium]